MRVMTSCVGRARVLRRDIPSALAGGIFGFPDLSSASCSTYTCMHTCNFRGISTVGNVIVVTSDMHPTLPPRAMQYYHYHPPSGVEYTQMPMHPPICHADNATEKNSLMLIGEVQAGNFKYYAALCIHGYKWGVQVLQVLVVVINHSENFLIYSKMYSVTVRVYMLHSKYCTAVVTGNKSVL